MGMGQADTGLLAQLHWGDPGQAELSVEARGCGRIKEAGGWVELRREEGVQLYLFNRLVLGCFQHQALSWEMIRCATTDPQGAPTVMGKLRS